MLAVVVKNFILMLLIIMIIHFMIKNYEADLIVSRRMSKTMASSLGCESVGKQPVPALEPGKELPSAPLLSTPKDATAKKPEANDATVATPDHTIVSSSTPSLEPALPREAIEELYDFVFNDKESSSDNLDSYFKEKLTTEKLERGCDVVCDNQEKNDVKNFCVNNVDAVFKADKNQKSVVKEHKTTGVLGTDTKKTQQGFQILYEYNDESSTDHLMGFETFESNYMTL